MDIEILYAAINISVLPAWALLIFAPRWHWTDKLVHRVWLPGLLCLSYILILLLKPAPPEGSGIGTLEQFMLLVSSPYSALEIWVELIVWDLFVGAWVAREAIRQNIHHGLVAPCLIAVLYFPPFGLFVFFCIRYALSRNTTLQEMTSDSGNFADHQGDAQHFGTMVND